MTLLNILNLIFSAVLLATAITTITLAYRQIKAADGFEGPYRYEGNAPDTHSEPIAILGDYSPGDASPIVVPGVEDEGDDADEKDTD